MPCARAMSSAPAAGRSTTRTATSAPRRPTSAAATIAPKFVPRPEARTATRTGPRPACSDVVRSDIDDLPRASPDLADLEDPLAGRLQDARGALHLVRGHHDEVPEAHVERAPHLRL